MNEMTTHDIERLVNDEMNRMNPETCRHIDPSEVAEEVAESYSFQAMVRVLTRRIVSKNRQERVQEGDHHDYNADGSIKVVNLTPHPITLYSRDGERVVGEIPMSDFVARVDTSASIDFPVTLQLEDGTNIQNVPLLYQERDVMAELPEPKEGVYYIVSAMVMDTFPNREDLIMVNTTNDRLGSIKDGRGKIKGTRSLRPSTSGVFRMLM